MPAYPDSKGRWRYRFAKNGRRYSGSTPKGGNTKRVAVRMESEHVDRVSLNSYEGKMPTVKDFAKRFLEYQKARTKPLTQKQQVATVNNHIVPAVGGLRVDMFNKERIDGLITKWGANSKPKTINTRLGTLRRMLVLAKDWKLISEVPKVEFVKVADATPRWLTDAEVAELIKAAEPQWQTMIFVGVRSGLRVGELRGLQWGDVDFARRVINVNRTDPGRKTMDATSPKSNRHRPVPMTGETIQLLAAMKPKDVKSHQWVWPALLRRKGETRARARSEKGCWHGVERAARKAGLAGVAWHTLRHTYASHLVMRGVPIRNVQKWLGHASVKETEKYAHLYPDHGYADASLLDTPLLTPDPIGQRATKALPESGPERNNSAELPDQG
jgi:integrase